MLIHIAKVLPTLIQKLEINNFMTNQMKVMKVKTIFSL